jgi:asparagine synthase (glutamine-hydrolysing)
MCGIVGLFGLPAIDPAPLEGMTRALAHRGPDGEKTQVFQGNGAPYAAMGVRRLAIVDPEGGEQPKSDEAGHLWVSLNGEIYNHARLRAHLVGSGVKFRSRSDTEVIANLVAQVGLERALEELRGMFAMAILDTRTRRLVLVRDRSGVKPLYWTQLADGTVAWASEARSLLGLPGVERQHNGAALQTFLMFEYIPSPWTAWAGIHKVEPGSLLEVGEDGPQQRRWWQPPTPMPGSGGNLDRWARSLHGALQVAVGQRLQADTEVGILLSGGLDSSAVTALAQARSDRPLKTFSIGVDAPGFDEAAPARKVAATLGTEHRSARLGPEDLERILPLLTHHMDEPLADSSLVATWRLMELVKEAGLKCVLSGDGADEALAGYPTYTAHRLAGPLAPLQTFIGMAAKRMATTWDGVSTDYKARRFAQGLGMPWGRRHQVWMGAWLPDELQAGPEVWEQVDAHAQELATLDPISRAMALDQRLYLPEGVLVKMDRASGAHGIEVRSPFLDVSVVELAAQIPLGHKWRARSSKHVLRVAMKGDLPEDICTRTKQGFGTPVGPWLRGPCRHLLDGLEDRVAPWIDPDLLRRVRQEHDAGTADHRRRLWSALVLANWLEGPWS